MKLVIGLIIVVGVLIALESIAKGKGLTVRELIGLSGVPGSDINGEVNEKESPLPPGYEEQYSFPRDGKYIPFPL